MIRNTILLVLVNALALYVTTQVLGDSFVVTGNWQGLLVTGAIFGILNTIVKPIIKVLTLPFVFLSAGLFIFVINAVILWLAQYVLGVLAFKDITILIRGGWLTWLYAILILGVMNVVINWLVKK